MSSSLRPRPRHWLTFAATVGAGVAADQVTKAQAAALPLGGLRRAAGPLFLRHAENPGIALGALPAGDIVPLVVGLLILCLLAVFATWGRLYPPFAAGCAAAVAGCAGNLADRVAHGHVTDFLVLGRLPVFNLADVLIVAGFALMIGVSAAADLREVPLASEQTLPLARPGGLAELHAQRVDLAVELTAPRGHLALLLDQLAQLFLVVGRRHRGAAPHEVETIVEAPAFRGDCSLLALELRKPPRVVGSRIGLHAVIVARRRQKR